MGKISVYKHCFCYSNVPTTEQNTLCFDSHRDVPTYGDLKSGDFFHPVSPPLPLDQPTHSPSPLPPPLNAPTHPPAAPSEYKNILPPLWICGKTEYLCQEFLLVNRRSNQTIGYMAMIAKESSIKVCLKLRDEEMH